MDISYQLFTTLQPPLKEICSLNTDELRYYDLVNIICGREINELGDKMTVELYTCEGYPLATYPGAYIRKLSDWCLEAYPDTPLLYAIPRPKIYTEKQTKHTTKSLTKGKDNILIGNINCSVRANCAKGTYYELVNSIQDITGIPAHLIQLKCNKLLILEPSSECISLNRLNIPITNNIVIEFTTTDEFWSPLWCNNFSNLQYQPTWHNQQSKYGTTHFFSCLYSLSDWMFENKENSNDLHLRTLGHIRGISGCPPLIHSLYLLFAKINITLPHLVSISEILVKLFINAKPKQYKDKGFMGAIIDDCEVTEYTNLFWTYFLSKAERNHSNSECFKQFSLIGHLAVSKMEDPLTVMNPTGSLQVVDRSTYKGPEENAKKHPDYKRLTTSFLASEAFVWQYTPMHPCGVDLTLEWEGLKSQNKNYPPLCIQPPLQVKSFECLPPAMIPIDSVKIAVYIGTAKDASNNHDYFDVLTGEKIAFDVEELDKTLKLNPPKCLDVLMSSTSSGNEMGKLTRHPDEVTFVILDTSGSMESVYLDGKTKNDSVIEAFLAFSDRTYAYDLKHAMGLILFTNTAVLQYPISENLKDFSSQFTSFPSGQMTSVYDAIDFAIQKFNEFDITYPHYSQVPKRLLCLTDGGDNTSQISPEQATNSLLKRRIIMDTVILDNELTHTHYIAKASGGYSFQPKSSPELLSIFENEPMLTLSMRKQVVPLLHPCDDSDPKLSQSKEAQDPSDPINIPLALQQHLGAAYLQFLRPSFTICSGWLTDGIACEFDEVPEHAVPDKINKPVITMHKCLTFAMRQKHLGNIVYNLTHTKRLLQELAHYATDPHKSFEIFPCEESIDFWQLILVGPENTCYEGGIFHLFIEFTDKYPSKPPNIRFLTPIYHCNINQAGKVCHSILDRFYVPGLRIRNILDYVYGLLMDPAPDDPLDSVKANELRFNPNSYNTNARAYTAKHAKQYPTTIDLQMKILGNNSPADVELVCPLTKELFIDPVSNNEGDTYEREAILAHIRSGLKYDPFSRLPLKEEDLRPNKTVIRLVEQYKKDVGKIANMKGKTVP